MVQGERRREGIAHANEQEGGGREGDQREGGEGKERVRKGLGSGELARPFPENGKTLGLGRAGRTWALIQIQNLKPQERGVDTFDFLNTYNLQISFFERKRGVSKGKHGGGVDKIKAELLSGKSV